ncbi:MAG: alkaline phosphatase family protein [Acidobacteriota bacterium]
MKRLPCLAIVLLLAACSAPGPAPQSTSEAAESTPPPPGTPRLVVQVVVDQMRGDYVERFRPLLTGGLKQLVDESVWFTDAHHEHSETVTAAGHATVASGRFPANHGVIGNGWVSRETKKDVYCVEDPEHGRSPVTMLGDAFGDRLKDRYPEAKVFSFGGKDRSSILCGGHRSDGSYWYDRSVGQMTTSTYYASGRDGLPEWLDALHASKPLDRYFGTLWEPLRTLEEVAPFGIEPLDQGFRRRGFPYSLGGLGYEPDPSFYGSIYSTPFIDTFVVDVAKAAIENEELGADEVPDFLSIALSALDAVGHGYGPDSPEMLDTLLRVDRLLGELFDFLDQTVGLEHVVLTLTSDHGVGTVPELAASRGLGGGRFGPEQVQCMQRAGKKLSEKYSMDELIFETAYVDHAAAEEMGLEPSEVARDVAAEVSQCRGIASAIVAADLRERGAKTELERLLLNSWHDERSPDVLLVLESNWLATSTTASHGTPYRYDTHVPWMVWSKTATAAQPGERVATADVMPTLAALTDVDPGEVDGVDRSSFLAQ